MNPINESVTPMTYIGEIARSSYRHAGGLSLTLACSVVLSILALLAFPARASVVIPAAIVAGIVFETAKATWRLYRRQNTALATTRMLLDLDTADRVLFERHLQETHRWREERLHARNADRVEQLFDEIKTLQTEVSTLSHGKAV